MFRQAVIAIHKANPSGVYSPIADKNIIFRQPFNSFGLAFTFSFDKAIFVPASDCQITIDNPDTSIVESLKYEITLPKTRPQIRIFAGESDYKMEAFNVVEINALKSTLQEMYTGYPMYYSHDQIPGGTNLSISLTDISLIASKDRITRSFTAGTTVTSMLNTLLSGVTDFDISLLTQNKEFAALTIEDDYIFNNRLLIEDVIQDLEEDYEFSHFINRTGAMEFFARKTETDATGSSRLISYDTGLIGHANTINWTDVSFQTYFARPDIFYPGELIELEAKNLNPNQNIKGRVITAGYAFSDAEADISYVINQFGQSFSGMAIIKI